MLCQSCSRLTTQRLICAGCRTRLRPAADRILPGGVRLIAAFEHDGPARDLVHHLKYRGVTGYADLVASLLAQRLPRLPLVPIPRVLTRRFRYGVDPADLLAQRLADLLKSPVFYPLTPPVHTRRRAGGDHASEVAGFHLRGSLNTTLLVVDDVVTTGATMTAAIGALGADRVVAAVAANVVQAVPRGQRTTSGAFESKP